MDSSEFKIFRKRLGKTQREMSELLGVSLKAICSYEQGWRTVPTHVERQLFFLLSRKSDNDNRQENCWDVLACPPNRRVECPAWEFNSGKFCWFINGTICECRSCKSWKEKIKICKKCEVTKRFLE